MMALFWSLWLEISAQNFKGKSKDLRNLWNFIKLYASLKELRHIPIYFDPVEPEGCDVVVHF